MIITFRYFLILMTSWSQIWAYSQIIVPQNSKFASKIISQSRIHLWYLDSSILKTSPQIWANLGKKGTKFTYSRIIVPQNSNIDCI